MFHTPLRSQSCPLHAKFVESSENNKHKEGRDASFLTGKLAPKSFQLRAPYVLHLRAMDFLGANSEVNNRVILHAGAGSLALCF
jgi:hypothetical protein